MADEKTPQQRIADLISRGRRFETACGEGDMVWHSWGSGPPLLLFHGAHGAWSHWVRNIEALAQKYTLWVADLPSYGESAEAIANTHEVYVATLAEGIAELPIDSLPAAMVGFSFGGVMAGHVAAKHPELVKHLVLVGTGGLDTPKGDVDLTRVRGLEGEERVAAHRHNLLNLMLHHEQSVDDVALFLQEENGMRGRLNPTHLVLPDKLLRVLPEVAAPVSAIWGEFDRPHPAPAVQRQALEKVCPGLDFRVVSNAGHWVMYEQADAFNEVLLDVLAKVEEAQPSAC